MPQHAPAPPMDPAADPPAKAATSAAGKPRKPRVVRQPTESGGVRLRGSRRNRGSFATQFNKYHAEFRKNAQKMVEVVDSAGIPRSKLGVRQNFDVKELSLPNYSESCFRIFSKALQMFLTSMRPPNTQRVQLEAIIPAVVRYLAQLEGGSMLALHRDAQMLLHPSDAAARTLDLESSMHFTSPVAWTLEMARNSGALIVKCGASVEGIEPDLMPVSPQTFDDLLFNAQLTFGKLVADVSGDTRVRLLNTCAAFFCDMYGAPGSTLVRDYELECTIMSACNPLCPPTLRCLSAVHAAGSIVCRVLASASEEEANGVVGVRPVELEDTLRNVTSNAQMLAKTDLSPAVRAAGLRERQMLFRRLLGYERTLFTADEQGVQLPFVVAAAMDLASEFGRFAFDARVPKDKRKAVPRAVPAGADPTKKKEPKKTGKTSDEADAALMELKTRLADHTANFNDITGFVLQTRAPGQETSTSMNTWREFLQDSRHVAYLKHLITRPGGKACLIMTQRTIVFAKAMRFLSQPTVGGTPNRLGFYLTPGTPKADTHTYKPTSWTATFLAFEMLMSLVPAKRTPHKKEDGIISQQKSAEHAAALAPATVAPA